MICGPSCVCGERGPVLLAPPRRPACAAHPELRLIILHRVLLHDSCCAAFTYNTMANVMTVFATAEYGFDDIETGEIYGYWGLMSSLWAMVLGPLIDVLGCRKTGIIGFTIYVSVC